MKKTKKLMPALVAAAVAVNLSAASAIPFGAAAEAEKFEFEDAEVTGTITVESDSGASGGEYLRMTEDGTITASFTVPSAGTYTLTVYAGGIGSSKTQNFMINGVSQGTIEIPESTGFEAVVKDAISLQKGENTLTIEKSWGWTDFDYFTVEEAVLSDITASDTTCSDPNATSETQSLMAYLASVYGSNIISGQQEIYKYGPHDFEYEFEYLNDLTGHYPAIRGFDFLNSANILYGSDDGTVDRMIDWANNKNGIVTASWHISVPKTMEGYSVGDYVDYNNSTYKPDETDFVPSNILVEGTVEREFYLKSLENIASQFLELQEAGVPVIWRPLHEAEGGGGENGGWFWWAKDGSAVYKEIWKLTYETLTETYGCHNLIWEWNSYNFSTSANWYPGDEYVDIIGYDKYSCTDWSTGQAVLIHNDSAVSSTFYGIMEKYDSKKMIAMAENDSFSTVDNLINDKAGWLYFCTWYDGGSADTNFLTDPIFNTEEDTIAMYQSDYCITLDELPADLYTNTDIATGTKPTVTTTTATATTEPVDTTMIKADITEGTDGYRFTLSEEIGDTLYVVLEADKSVSFANGCVGISVSSGVDYWVSYQWQISKSGTVEIDLTDPYEISYNNGEDKVTDEAAIAEIAAEAQKQNTGLVQIWWVNDGTGEQLDNSNVVLSDVYIIKDTASTDDTAATTADTTSTNETTTETTVTSDTETTETSETTETTASTIDLVSTLYGDVNLDGVVSMVDIIYLNKYLSGSVVFNEQQRASADCAYNGDIEAADATVLLKFLGEKIDSLPVLQVY